MQTETEDEVLVRARKRVEETRGFVVHVFMYVVVISGLFVINAITRESDGDWWAIWPAVGWGIAVAIHAAAYSTETWLLGPDWEERKIREYVQRDRARHA